MFEELQQLSQRFLEIKNASYQRYFIKTHPFSHRMSILIGQRGVGKTTTLIQALLNFAQGDRWNPKILYLQADHFLMKQTTLYEIAEQFHLFGGKWIVLDEVHKYPNWSQELKSIYDTFPSLHIIASGSSALQIHRGSHDLARRAVVYFMQGMSFREYLEITYSMRLPTYTLSEICKNHLPITEQILKEGRKKDLSLLREFHSYLKKGYYPYFHELNNEALYQITLEQSLHTTLESDLPALYPHLTGISIQKMKQLFAFIASCVPFIPNWQNIKATLEIGDLRTLKTYFTHLEDAQLIRFLPRSTQKFRQLEASSKVYLENPNQLYAISSTSPNKGTVRETFFLNMVSLHHSVSLPSSGDFFIDSQYVFEIGGRKKNFEQIKKENQAYLALDEIEQGIGKKIPLWLFGFLY